MKCQVADCNNAATRKGKCLCEKHYYRQYRYGDVNFTTKAANGSRLGLICEIPGCSRLVQGRKLCNMHLQRVWRLGAAGEAEQRHVDDGKGTISQNGYRVFSEGGKKIKEHRRVAEIALGKPLPPNAVVHHVNGDRTDNRPCNLVICPDEAYHKLLHARQKEFGYFGKVVSK